MTEKTFTVVGTSIRAGVLKLRLANNGAAARTKVLEKDGHTEVRLFDLPKPMTAAEAEAWLAQQGDAVPVRAVVQPKQRVAKQPKQGRGKTVLVLANAATPAEIAHEELGFAASGQSREFWDNQALVTRQEMSRNAAWAAGIACPRGTYAELDAWLLADGVYTNEDGTVLEIA